MPTQIFVNLAVKDLDRSKEFFQQLGYSFNEQLTDATGACLVISDTIYAMLLTEAKFSSFLSKGKQLADAVKTTEVLLALSCESREAVNHLADTAIHAGGSEARPPEDHGFMFGRSFHDLDGHVWEVFYMDLSAIPKQ